jgi:hypothetical protein
MDDKPVRRFQIMEIGDYELPDYEYPVDETAEAFPGDDSLTEKQQHPQTRPISLQQVDPVAE